MTASDVVFLHLARAQLKMMIVKKPRDRLRDVRNISATALAVILCQMREALKVLERLCCFEKISKGHRVKFS